LVVMMMMMMMMGLAALFLSGSKNAKTTASGTNGNIRTGEVNSRRLKKLPVDDNKQNSNSELVRAFIVIISEEDDPTDTATEEPNDLGTEEDDGAVIDANDNATTSSTGPDEPFGPIQYVGNEGGFFADYPLGVCQGDCDDDSDCLPGLYCFQRTNPFDDRAPDCTGGDSLGLSFDVCVYNTSSGLPLPTYPTVDYFGAIEYVGNDGTWYSSYPLGVCLGDCDTDDDCEDGLLCHHRTANNFVPGCTGGEEESSSADFCIWNTTNLTKLEELRNKPSIPEGTFRLKLYWEEGYRWQNETFEREWCMNYNYNGYPGTGVCWYGREATNCTSSEIYMGLCLNDDPRQWFTYVDVGTSYTDNDDHPEVMIQTSGESPPRCMTRKSNSIYLSPECDPDNDDQRFYALRGDLRGDRFELSQYRVFDSDTCITSAHHPKSGKVLFNTDDSTDSFISYKQHGSAAANIVD